MMEANLCEISKGGLGNLCVKPTQLLFICGPMEVDLNRIEKIQWDDQLLKLTHWKTQTDTNTSK